MGRLDTPLRKLHGNATDFLRRPVDEGWFCFCIADDNVFGSYRGGCWYRLLWTPVTQRGHHGRGGI
jgi:hypothetical protein